jgi:methionyl-tRNA formyltransferase
LGININYPIKIKEVIDQISDLYGKGVNMLIHQLVNSTLVEQKQNDAEASYSVWRDEDDYYINWNSNSEIIKRHIDAVGFPYLGARTKYKNQTLVIMDAIVEKELDVVNRTPGKVLKKSGNRYYVICGKGILSIKQFFKVEGDIFQPKKFRMKFE